MSNSETEQSVPGPQPDTSGAGRTSDRPATALRRWPAWGLGLAYAAAAIGLPIHWLAYEPSMGPSLQYLPTYGAIVLLYLLTLVWIALSGRIGRVSRRLLLAAMILPVVLMACSIRHIGFSGDMRLIVTWRWEQTYAERIAAHRQQTPQQKISLSNLFAHRAEDMPGYRGSNRDGVIEGPTFSAEQWEASPPKELWRRPCGGGYSQFAIAGSRLVTLEQQELEEAVVCYDAQTGQEVWTTRYPALFSEGMGGDGPRSTPTIAGNRVYAVGAMGDLHALSLANGEKHWHVNILTSLNVPNVVWGVTASPLVIGELVIVNPGGPRGNGIAAYRVGDGSLAWKTAGVDAFGPTETVNRPGYTSPFLATIAGVEQLLVLDGTGLRAYVPESGEMLWETPFENGAGVNAAQPIVFDDGRILLSASYDVGSSMRQVSRDGESWKVKTLWGTESDRNLELRSKFSTPVLHDGLVYGLDEGIFVCIDPATGEQLWKGGRTGLRGRYGHGQLLYTNGQILVETEKGSVVLIDPSREGLKELGHFRALKSDKNWNPPALSNGKLYVRNHLEAAAYELVQASPPETP